MTRIKICGIKREDEVLVLNQYLVSYAGFIFAKSKRQVTVEKCNELASILRQDIKKVGVFVDEEVDRVNEIAKECNLDFVQLHGRESVDYIKQIKVPVWKTIPVKDETSLELIKLYEPFVDGILFETYHEKLKGGTGQQFDWTLMDLVEKSDLYKRILAGGINPLNAKEAIESVKPDILDVNSGLEVDGFKTLEKVNQLFKELKI